MADLTSITKFYVHTEAVMGDAIDWESGRKGSRLECA